MNNVITMTQSLALIYNNTTLQHQKHKIINLSEPEKSKEQFQNCPGPTKGTRFDWIEQCFTSPPTQYRLYRRRFLQAKRPNQQYQSTEGTNSTQTNQTYNKQTWTQNTASPRVYNNIEWLGDGSHRGQVRQAWTAVGEFHTNYRHQATTSTAWSRTKRSEN